MKLQNFQGKPQKNQVHQILWGTNQKDVKNPTCFLHQHGREHPKSKHSNNITQRRRRRNNPAAQKKKKKKKLGGIK
jgi:hypothetical protein